MSKWVAVCQVILELHKLNGIPKTGGRTRSIVLRIPFELPPSAVAQIYEDARDAAGWRLAEPAVRMKLPIEEKNVRAALFAAKRSQSGRKWGDVRDEWNAYYGAHDWRFTSTQSFISVVRKTYRRLTGNDLEWKRNRGDST